MPETAWQEFTRRYPWAQGLSGQLLSEAIGAHWDEFEADMIQTHHILARLAMYVAYADMRNDFKSSGE